MAAGRGGEGVRGNPKKKYTPTPGQQKSESLGAWGAAGGPGSPAQSLEQKEAITKDRGGTARREQAGGGTAPPKWAGVRRTEEEGEEGPESRRSNFSVRCEKAFLYGKSFLSTCGSTGVATTRWCTAATPAARPCQPLQPEGPPAARAQQRAPLPRASCAAKFQEEGKDVKRPWCRCARAVDGRHPKCQQCGRA